MSPQLDELLASPPGDGITVSRNDDRIEIHIRAARRKGRNQVGELLALAGPLIVVAAGYAALEFLLSELDQPIGWWFMLGVISIAAVTFYFWVFRGGDERDELSRLYQNHIEMTEEHLRIQEMKYFLDISWDEIECFRVMLMEKPGEQLYARLNEPWVQGRGDGIAVVTSQIIYKTLELWHQDVSEWVARVWREYSNIELSDDAEIEKRLRDDPILQEVGSGITLGSLRLAAIMLIGVGGANIFWHCLRFQDEWSAERWKSVSGQIVSTQKLNHMIKVPPLKVRYEYEVQGVRYENDRYRIGNDFSEAGEIDQSELNVGDPVEVWYHPDDPQRAALILDLSWWTIPSLIFLWAISLTMLVGGLCMMVYSFFREEAANAQFPRGLTHPEAGLQE